ncbi:MAG: hypothetical protein GXY67_00075 [Clostridiales bacterium]|mgnify:CR=1 FL=1|nr:hypothetical protein [Clostridiales bacterium]
MKRHWKLILSLLVILATLSSCSGQQNPPQQFAEVTQYIGPVAENTPDPQQQADTSGSSDSIFSNNPFDVSSDGEELTGAEEEGFGDEEIIDFAAQAEASTPYPYAGSTPIPLDPVDMPSPTPRTELVFAYDTYTTSLKLTFEGPRGWVPDESIPEQFILTEPDTQVKDKQPGIVKVYAIPVNNDYSESNLKTEVLERLRAISSTNFEEWSPSLTASRYLMGSKGVYANYSGTMADGVKVGGRIHCTTIDKVLYCIEIVYPLAYKDDYLNIFSKVRETIKRVQ